MRIICITGLPASGKTFYAMMCKGPNDLVLDDLNDKNLLIQALTQDYQAIYITDPYFCLTHVRSHINAFLKENNLEPEWVFFENNKEKCLINVDYRNDGRKVTDFIDLLSPRYTIPIDVIPVPIWNP
jgi:hypothetical protein